ncbi:MAG: hypothetical protein ACXVEE_42100 [Polyangiales bacterium]
MRGLFVVVMALGCHSSEVEQPAPAEGPSPPIATCPATHEADGPACAPKFDLCAEGEISKLGGGCVAVGVPKDGCAPGWVHDTRGGCAPMLPAETCAPGKMAVPGDVACADVAPCGEGTWGAIPDAPGTVYVDASAPAGGTGTRASPLASLADALASSADVIALAAGTYTGDVTIDRARTVIGRCPSMVTVVGTGTGDTDAAVTIHAKATVSGVAITGPGAAVKIESTVDDVVLEKLWVHAAQKTGVWPRRDTRVTLRRSLIEDVAQFGVVASGSKVRVESTLVRDVHEDPRATAGVRANPDPELFHPADVTIVGSLIERNQVIGVQVVSSSLTLDGTVVRDTLPAADSSRGTGVGAFFNATTKIVPKLVVQRSLVERSLYAGILVQDGDAIIESTVVRDTQLAQDTKIYGRGIIAQSTVKPVTLTVRDSLVEKNHETGIDVNGDAKALIERTIVRDTALNKKEGRGIFGEVLNGNAPALTVTDVFVARNPMGGIGGTGMLTITGARLEGNGNAGILARGGTVKVRSTFVHATKSIAGGTEGHGFIARFDDMRGLAPSVDLADVAVHDAVKAGIGIFGGSATIDSCSVRDIASEPASGNAGIGIVIQRFSPTQDGTLDLKSTRVDRATGAGIYVVGAKATIASAMERATRANPFGDFGDGLVLSGRFFAPSPDSKGTLFTASATVSGSVFERNARAGIAVFGSQLTLSGTWMTCNGFDVDAETAATSDAPAEAEFHVDEDGTNHCGCGLPASCSAQSANLKASASVTPPKDS